jgi:hypothetical protein
MYTVILLLLLSHSSKMTVSPRARVAREAAVALVDVDQLVRNADGAARARA